MIDVQKAILHAIARLLLPVLFLGSSFVTARAADDTRIPPPPAGDDFDYGRLMAAIARDIAGLKQTYPQLEDFSVARHLQADGQKISYSYHTHEPSGQGGWTSGVPNPDEDGIWLHIDFHDPGSSAQLHTQPMTVAAHCVGNMRVSFLSLEGAKTISVDGAIWGILKKHGARECDQQPHSHLQ